MYSLRLCSQSRIKGIQNNNNDTRGVCKRSKDRFSNCLPSKTPGGIQRAHIYIHPYIMYNAHSMNNRATSTDESPTNPLPHRSPLPPPRVPHIKQLYNWDCGLACLSMVLQTIHHNNNINPAYTLPNLIQSCPVQSIWTIDLAHILSHLLITTSSSSSTTTAPRISITFSTTTLGINYDAYAHETFYSKCIDKDRHRVEQLFSLAPSAGIIIKQKSITIQQLADIVADGRHLVIALVNKALFFTNNNSSNNINRVGYFGHYIVIAEYNKGKDEFAIRDPAAVDSGNSDIEEEEEWIKAGVLDVARRDIGTDEDLLLIEYR